jgi:hypothetical protein
MRQSENSLPRSTSVTEKLRAFSSHGQYLRCRRSAKRDGLLAPEISQLRRRQAGIACGVPNFAARRLGLFHVIAPLQGEREALPMEVF